MISMHLKSSTPHIFPSEIEELLRPLDGIGFFDDAMLVGSWVMSLYRELFGHFSCKAVGNVLVEMMQAHPEQKMTVLCGHTHSSGETEILPNLRVRTGAAVYGRPQIQDVLEL